MKQHPETTPTNPGQKNQQTRGQGGGQDGGQGNERAQGNPRPGTHQPETARTTKPGTGDDGRTGHQGGQRR